MSSNCDTCDRSFGSEEALQQHLLYSRVHAPSFNCKTCDRSFSSEEALEQHLRDSPEHAPSFDCETCDRSFGSKEALEQHLRDSPVHAPSFYCETCDRSFGNEEALEQHRRDSRVHQQVPETPLDVFFHSFPTFNYDPSLPPATSYAYLREHEGWRRGDAASSDAWSGYQDALESELRMWYGAESDLNAWHALCRAIGVEPLPRTCELCEEVRARYTKFNALILIRIIGCTKDTCNIIDLMEWGRRLGNTEERVQTFRTVAELRTYSKRTGKIFRNTIDREDGNVVLRHLLRKIFREA